ncbi:MAG: TonB-dependent receptor plug domain-containing protein, partial [Pseudomonadota bacterium]
VNTVDLTAIPTSIISRVEILKDGASSIYGADAVAGVINIITRDNLDGFQINGAASVTQEGGGEGYNIDLSWGKVLDRTSFSVSAGYARQNKLEAIERDYSQCPISPRLTDQDFDGTLDNRNPITNEELCFGFIYGLVSSPFGFVRYEPGLTNADPSDPFFDAGIAGFGIPNYTRTPINGFDTRPGADPTSDFFDNDGAFYRDELSPTVQNIVSERDTFYAVGQVSHDFELAGRATTAFAEIFLNRRETAATGGYRQFFPAVPGTNPTNPFGTNGPLAGFGGFTVLPVLPSYQIQDPTQRVEVDRGQLYAGLRGDLFGDTWTYEAVFGYGTSEGTYEQDNWLQNQVDFAVDAVFDTNGNLVCRPLDANAPADIQADFSGCVPLQLFTSEALLAGSLPADQLNYISKVTVGNTTYDQLTFNAFASGDLFELPAGTVQGVFGVDYRYQEIVDTPDIEAQRDNVWGRSVAG